MSLKSIDELISRGATDSDSLIEARRELSQLRNKAWLGEQYARRLDGTEPWYTFNRKDWLSAWRGRTTEVHTGIRPQASVGERVLTLETEMKNVHYFNKLMAIKVDQLEKENHELAERAALHAY